MEEIIFKLGKVEAMTLELCSIGSDIPLLLFLRKNLYLEVLGIPFGADENLFPLLRDYQTVRNSLKKECSQYKDFIEDYKLAFDDLMKTSEEYRGHPEVEQELQDLKESIEILGVKEILNLV